MCWWNVKPQVQSFKPWEARKDYKNFETGLVLVLFYKEDFRQLEVKVKVSK